MIIDGGSVLTMDPHNRLIEGGAVAVRGNSIAAVDRSEVIRQKFVANMVLDAKGKVVMPGLVDTYGHAGHGMIKAIYRPDLGWPTGGLYFHATTDRWWFADGVLSAVERLRFGVTTGFSVVGATPARMDSPVFAERQAEALTKVGIRGVLGVGPPDPHISHLAEPWSGTLWDSDKSAKRFFSYEQAMRNSVEIVEKWHGKEDGRIQVALHYPYLFGRQAAHPKIPFVYNDSHLPLMIEKADEIREVADRYGVLVHTHAFVGSVSFALKHYGVERVRRLLGLGGVCFAHCNGLAEEEIRTLGEHKSGICIVPFTHENILYGACPAIELLKAGAIVTISTDGAAPYVSYDLFKDISRAIWTQWLRFKDQSLLPPGKALRMVTIDAAKALKMDHLVGSLESGKRADIILVDFAKPHLTPKTFVPGLLVYYVNGNDVDTVMVNGKLLMQNRTVLSVDETEVLQMVREETELAFKRYDVTPYLQMDNKFWKNWQSYE